MIPGRQTKFRARKKKKTPIIAPRPRLDRGEGQEVLTGVVHGLKASALEERLAKALDAHSVQYEFRRTTIRRGEPGYKELDFLIYSRYGNFGVSVQDTTFIHKGTEAEDKAQEEIVVETMRQQGVYLVPLGYPEPGSIIGTFSQEVLGNQDDADKIVKEYFSL